MSDTSQPMKDKDGAATDLNALKAQLKALPPQAAPEKGETRIATPAASGESMKADQTGPADLDAMKKALEQYRSQKSVLDATPQPGEAAIGASAPSRPAFEQRGPFRGLDGVDSASLLATPKDTTASIPNPKEYDWRGASPAWQDVSAGDPFSPSSTQGTKPTTGKGGRGG